MFVFYFFLLFSFSHCLFPPSFLTPTIKKNSLFKKKSSWIQSTGTQTLETTWLKEYLLSKICQQSQLHKQNKNTYSLQEQLKTHSEEMEKSSFQGYHIICTVFNQKLKTCQKSKNSVHSQKRLTELTLRTNNLFIRQRPGIHCLKYSK